MGGFASKRKRSRRDTGFLSDDDLAGLMDLLPQDEKQQALAKALPKASQQGLPKALPQRLPQAHAVPPETSSIPAFVVKTLYFIRHGQSLHNIKDPNKPDTDYRNTALSEEGKTQAGKIKGSIALAIVSPLRRTIQTYAYSQLTVGRLITLEDIREWAGWGVACMYEHEEQRDPNKAKESWSEFQVRVARAIRAIAQQPEHEIAIISHGGTLGEMTRQLKLPCHAGWANAEVRRFDKVLMPLG